MRSNWLALLSVDLLIKALVLVVAAPLTALAWRLYLVWTGQPLLTDAEIAGFFLHPLGWVALLLLGGVGVATVGIGLGAMVRVVASPEGGGMAGGIAAVVAAVMHGSTLFRVSAAVIGALVVTAAPFLIGGLVAFQSLLTAYDINYYLAEKPPAFYAAAAIIGGLLLGMMLVWLWLALRWSMSLPLIMLDAAGPLESLRRSAAMTRDRQWWLLRWGGVWLLTIWIVSSVLTAITVFVTRVVLDAAGDSLWSVVLLSGTAMGIWFIGQLLIALVISMSLAVCLLRTYRALGGTGQVVQEPREAAATRWFTLRPRRVAWWAVGAALVAGVTGLWAVQSVNLEDRVTITAHRGASLAATENTMAAFELAIEAGADFIELDVQETRDGVVAVVHDQDLLRFGGPATKVWDSTLEQLQAVNLTGDGIAANRVNSVPALSDVLESARDRIRVNIELKYYGHDIELEQRVIDLVERHQMVDQIVIMSLHAPAVQKVRELRPDWTVGLLAAKTFGDLSTADVDFFAVHHGLATRTFIRRAHTRGQEVHAWTVNDPVLMSSLISRGVDVLITDDPAAARQVLEERKALGFAQRVILDLTARLGLNR